MHLQITGRPLNSVRNFGYKQPTNRTYCSACLLHIFAIDKDERALDTAKANMWKEAVKLNPRQYNYRRLKQISHILPNLGLNFTHGDSLAEVEIEKQLEILSNHTDKIAAMQAIRQAYIENPFDPEVIEPMSSRRKQFAGYSSACTGPEPKDQLFVTLECWPAFFASDGSVLPVELRGFSGVISNPPWEAIKPVQKEYADVDKGSRDICSFSEYFKNKLQSDEAFRNGWRDYQDFYRNYTDFLFSRYTH